MKSKILLSIFIIVVLIQLIRPMPNISDDNSKSITTAYEVPDDIQKMLQRACADCHSNKTNYPWYSKIQPVAWWLNHHIEEGKEELNFSEFKNYKPKRQKHKLEEIAEQVEAHEMPMTAYTWTHPAAKLTEEQRTQLINWAKAAMEEINLADTVVKMETKEADEHEHAH